ncbi:MAG TPA: iron-containing alcohol dehydrogenase [Pirellulales bacterium]|nr:iron-containing alcohol dehydrogenase [Pirellulales bacterium]
MRQTWTFHSAGQIVFGCGAAAQLGELATRMGLARVLIVTDRALIGAGLLAPVEGPLSAAGVVVETYDGGEPEPSLDVAGRCVAQARRFAPDGLVGLGGGSNMDLAKIAAAVLAHGGSASDYIGDGRVPGPVLPLICVPTTAGTGSEVTAAAVLTDAANQIKVGILSNYLRPRLAVVDPRLTLTCPRKVTADSGIDALTHAIEAYTAVDNEAFPLPSGERTVYQGRHPLGDCLAEKAIHLIGRHIECAVHQGDDRAAREGMALGAMIAGLAFSNVGVALVHAMEYPLGGATHCSHGEGNGLLLPFVMRFNLPARIKQFAHIARLLGEDAAGLGEAALAERAIAAVERLKRAIGIPDRLRDLGVRRDQLRPFAEKTLGIKRILRVNPRQVTVDDVTAIFEAAW